MVLHAAELLDPQPPTCGLSERLGDVATRLAGSRYRFSVVVNEQQIVLGRLRGSAIEEADEDASVESAMESGPSTVRPGTPARELVERLTKRELRTAIVTTPNGRLLGVVHRADAERRLSG